MQLAESQDSCLSRKDSSRGTDSSQKHWESLINSLAEFSRATPRAADQSGAATGASVSVASGRSRIRKLQSND